MSGTQVSIASVERELRLERDGTRWTVTDAEGQSVELEILSLRNGEAEIRLGGHRVLVPYATAGDRVDFRLDGELWRAEVMAKGRRRRGRATDHSMAAPMPGVVLKIFPEVGDVVAKGDPLIVLEAMKMEHQITAPYAGTVESIACAVGDMVQPGVDLIALVPQEAE